MGECSTSGLICAGQSELDYTSGQKFIITWTNIEKITWASTKDDCRQFNLTNFMVNKSQVVATRALLISSSKLDEVLRKLARKVWGRDNNVIIDKIKSRAATPLFSIQYNPPTKPPTNQLAQKCPSIPDDISAIVSYVAPQLHNPTRSIEWLKVEICIGEISDQCSIEIR